MGSNSTLLYCSVSNSALRQLHLFYLLLLLSCNQVLYSVVEGRSVVKLQEFMKEEEKEEEVVGVAMIGSRPPRCAGKCMACGRCEAVQVPAGPQQSAAGHISAAAASGNDDDSNSIYKPLSWKCKCGGVILNP